MRILIAEDEPKARRYLARGLGEQGYAVELAEDGNVVLAMLREHAFDAAVLDVMLPGRDGFSIVRTMRSEAIRTPVLFLTARDHMEDRVRDFEIGANDYLVKPFAFAELLARLRNLLRQSEPAGEAAMLRVGPLLIDSLRHQLTRDGHPLQLTPKEYALLLALLARRRGVGQGTGLGLSIVRTIVELHRGTVTVASMRGSGTTVSMQVPSGLSMPTGSFQQEPCKHEV